MEADKELREQLNVLIYEVTDSDDVVKQLADLLIPALIAWRDRAVVANVKRELSNIVDPGDGTVYSYTRIGTNAIKRLSALTKEEGAL